MDMLSTRCHDDTMQRNSVKHYSGCRYGYISRLATGSSSLSFHIVSFFLASDFPAYTRTIQC